jgi:hypothetical protein
MELEQWRNSVIGEKDISLSLFEALAVAAK